MIKNLFSLNYKFVTSMEFNTFINNFNLIYNKKNNMLFFFIGFYFYIYSRFKFLSRNFYLKKFINFKYNFYFYFFYVM